jgi:hypothetical protein
MFEKFKAMVHQKALERLRSQLEMKVGMLDNALTLLTLHLESMSTDNRVERIGPLATFKRRAEEIKMEFLFRIRNLPEYQPTAPEKAVEEFDEYLRKAHGWAGEAQGLIDSLDRMEVNTYSTPNVSR